MDYAAVIYQFNCLSTYMLISLLILIRNIMLILISIALKTASEAICLVSTPSSTI